MIEGGPDGNPESPSVHRKSPKYINQIPNSLACPCRMQVRLIVIIYGRLVTNKTSNIFKAEIMF